MDKLLKEAEKLLTDLKRCGSFYNSAIELDMYQKYSINGEEFENRIDELLKKIQDEI